MRTAAPRHARLCDRVSRTARHHQALAQLERRLAAERLVAAIAARFVAATGPAIDLAIQEALAGLGAFAQVDRSYLLQVTHDLTFADNTHEWCAPGIDPQIDALQHVPLAEFGWFLARLQTFEPIHLSALAELPPEAAAERAALEAQDIRSILLVPVVAGGILLGMLGFDAVRAEKTWEPEDIGLLQVVGQVIAASLDRERNASRERERARLDGVLLAARTAEHGLNNQLALVIGYTECAVLTPNLPSAACSLLQEVLRAAAEATAIVKQLHRITHLAEVDLGAPGGPVLDLEASIRPRAPSAGADQPS